jgi:hypothetical protein
MRVIVMVGLAVALAACQTAYQGNEDSPYYNVPVGSQLVLNKEIHFDPDQVSVYVQFGKVLPFSAVQKYETFCKFELNHLVHAARTIAPSEMRVTRVYQERSYDLFAGAARPQYVDLTARRLVQSGGFDQGGPGQQSFIERMDLHSPNQAEIYRLTCARWASYPTGYENLSITEIRRTLDPLFTLRTPVGG